VFLSETRQNKDVIESVQRRIGYANCLPVCVKGKGGGLALFVSNLVKVDLISFGKHHIDTTVTDLDGVKTRYTFVYGEPRPQDRLEFWKLMKRIKPMSPEPWFVAGDFNECLFQSEHMSARRRSESRMQDFRDALRFCNLHDLGFRGQPWTFNNKQQGKRNVRVRLDRAVASPAWTAIYPQATVQHMVTSRSDHCPIVITLKEETNKPVKLPPRYEAMWEREPSLNECIEEAWVHLKPASNLEEIQQKISHTMTAMGNWSRKEFGSVNSEIKRLKKRLGNLQRRNYIRNQLEIKKVAARLDELLLREEIMWR
jgi:hypothetical protein